MASEATGGGNASDGEPILSPNQVDLTCKLEGVVLKYLGRLKFIGAVYGEIGVKKWTLVSLVWNDIGG